jgi:hypothetical protein
MPGTSLYRQRYGSRGKKRMTIRTPLSLAGLAVCAAAASAGAAGSSSAAWANLNAGELLLQCQSDSLDRQFRCRGFLTGAIMANDADRSSVYALLEGMTSGYAREKHKEGAAPEEINAFRERIVGFRGLLATTVFFCVPATTTYEEIKRTVVERIEDHPENHDSPASREVAAALIQRYPCG